MANLLPSDFLTNPNAVNDQTNQVNQPQNNNWDIRNWLPTIGGMGGVGLGALIPGLGETGASEVAGGAIGQGVGQALEDYLYGKKPGWDVAEQTAFGGVGGLAGLGASKVLGGILGRFADEEATGALNLTAKQLAGFAEKNGIKASDLLGNVDATGTNLDNLGGKIAELGKSYDTTANIKIPIDKQAFIDNVNQAKQEILGNGEITPSSAEKSWNNLNSELQQKIYPKLGITQNEDGSLVADTTINPTMSDILNAKRSYYAQTTKAQFAADPANYSTNRAAGDILQNTLNDSAKTAGQNGLLSGGEQLAKKGTTLMGLKNLEELAQGRVGVGQSQFGLGSLIRKGIGAGASTLFGIGPIPGIIGETTAESALKNPTIAKILSGVATKGANAMGSNVGQALTIGAGATGVGALGNVLLKPSIGNTGNQETTNNSQNPTNQLSPILAAGATNNNVAQTSTNVNPSASNQGIPSFDGKTVFPAQLPSVATYQNAIPGQPYSQDQQLNDLAKIDQFLKDNAGNPAAYDYANVLRAQIDQKTKINTDYTGKYIEQNGLDAGAKAFMQTAPVDYQNLNSLRGLIQQNGATDIMQAYLNGNQTYLTARERADPTGNVGLMVNLMAQLKLRMPRAGATNITPFDQALIQAFSPGQTTAENLRNLDHVQSLLLQQWQQYAPVYGLTSGQPALTSNSTIDNALHAVATGQ